MNKHKELYSMKNMTEYSDIYKDYISDESKTEGKCSFIAFPESEEDILSILSAAKEKSLSVTVQGGLTGITGGAVPSEGLVLNLSRYKKISELKETGDYAFLTVAPGCLLSEVREYLKNTDYFFPNDPTETSASIGGMVSCNSSGALSYSYRSIRNWIEELKIILPDCDTVTLTRGENFAKNYDFSITTDQGNIIKGTLPKIHYSETKSASGYYIRPDMDLTDIFIGMEGTLGIISSVTLRLIHKKPSVTGIAIFFPEEKKAVDFVKSARGEKEFPSLNADAIEFFDCNSLSLANRMKREREMFPELSQIKDEYKASVYIEFQRNTEEETETAIENLYNILDSMNISDEDTWCAFSEKEMSVLKLFRHAIPESVNTLIGEIKRKEPKITKLSTDMSVPDEYLSFIFDLYKTDLKTSGLDYVIFGHIGNNHLHVNIIPKNAEEYSKGKELYKKWAKEAVAKGGAVSAEHGIGKIKKEFLKIMFSQEEIEDMKNFRNLFDKKNILNQGNLF